MTYRLDNLPCGLLRRENISTRNYVNALSVQFPPYGIRYFIRGKVLKNHFEIMEFLFGADNFL